MRLLAGEIGHALLLVAFIAALMCAGAYLFSERKAFASSWKKDARRYFLIHSGAAFGAAFCLFWIIFNHYFEYNYAFAHSSRELPWHYMLACFWEGQEGSFLLWILWHAALGLILLRTSKEWESSVMIIFSCAQAFLAAMILGVVLPGDIKLGSSPFILLRDAVNDPVFISQPDFIPASGNGLNPLLQNYWMVIHPPTLFLGFALALPPFAFAMAGLWKKKYAEWIEPAFPWTVIGSAVLGLGILMGGYWAYETLSFGGYWNWDPVENASYVPWLILIGLLHAMVVFRANKRGLKISFVLCIAAFILVLYSTFLTRSGVLGDASVHSFTDLGLSGQLLICLLFFVALAIGLLGVRWRDIPENPQRETSFYSKEFWIFFGVAVLCLMSFQVLLPTSIPVWNKLMASFGIDSKAAPPADQVAYYSKFQLWFAVALALASGTAQFFWWKNLDKKNWLKEITPTLVLSLLAFALLMLLWKIHQPAYMALLFAGAYLFMSAMRVFFNFVKKNFAIAGGALAHAGVALMLIGVLMSSGFSRVVSLNNTGMLISKELPADFNRDNLLLFVNEPREMHGYKIEYLGEYAETRGRGYVKKTHIAPLMDDKAVVIKKTILSNGDSLKVGDTLRVYLENVYYKIQMSKDGKGAISLFPRVQQNEAMGGFIASPDITRRLTADLYTHVSLPMSRKDSVEWSAWEETKVKMNETFFANDYPATLDRLERISRVHGAQLLPNDVAVKAVITVQGEHETFEVSPIFLIVNGNRAGHIPVEINDLGVRVKLANILPDTNEFIVGVSVRQKDWVVIKSLEKPYINILWLGTLTLMAGFALSAARRMKRRD